MHPLLEEFDRLHEGELEDKAEVLLEEMGPEQPLVDALDPRQLAFLAGGEVLGVLRERVGAPFELPGVKVVTAPANAGVRCSSPRRPPTPVPCRHGPGLGADCHQCQQLRHADGLSVIKCHTWPRRASDPSKYEPFGGRRKYRAHWFLDACLEGGLIID